MEEEKKKKDSKRVKVEALDTPLLGVEGEPLPLIDGQGNHIEDLTARRLLILILTQGEQFLERKKQGPHAGLNDKEKVDAFILAQRVGDKMMSEVEISPEDVVLLKKLGLVRCSVEWYGMLLTLIDPEALK